MKNHFAEAQRQRWDWSQTALAERQGLSRQTALSIERGRFNRGLPLAFWLGAFAYRLEELFAVD